MSDLRTAVDALMKLIGPPPADTIPDVAGTYNQRVAAVRVALASPPAPAEGERDEVYAAARALLDAISHWDLTVAVDVASARLERALARAPRPQHEGGRP